MLYVVVVVVIAGNRRISLEGSGCDYKLKFDPKAKMLTGVLYLLAHIDFPEISQRKFVVTSNIITQPVTANDNPVIFMSNKCRVIVYPVLSLYVVVSPLSNIVWTVISPLITLHGQLRVIAF